MNDTERIAALEREVADLKAQIERIVQAVTFLSARTVKHLMDVTDDINEIHESLGPSVHKLFPKIADGYEEIDMLLRRRPSSDTKDS